MDPLSQITLGAVVGATVMGKRYGRKSALVGAICGTIPDLDVFLDYGDPVSNMTNHRGFSHSFIFCICMTPILGYLFSIIRWLGLRFKDWRVHLGVFLALVTHPILDSFTIYGTQLLWPLNFPPVGWGSMFIIDPLYTIPFFICLLWYLVTRQYKAVLVGLVLSTSYLGWSMGVQHYVETIAKPQVQSETILVQPTPFNTLLWRVVVMHEDEYQVGYYSLFDKSSEIEFETYKTNPSLLPDTASVDRLLWFTKGFYSVTQQNNQIVFSDLRMGLEPDDYVFEFNVFDQPATRVQKTRNMSRLNDVWDRIFMDLSDSALSAYDG